MKLNDTAKILSIALGSEQPIKGLLNMAIDFLKGNNIDRIHDIDVMLNKKFLDYIRKGTKNDLDGFIYCINSFIDGNDWKTLNINPKGNSYLDKWDHLSELCSLVVENYDPELAFRLVNKRDNGAKLIAFLNTNGTMRCKELAASLEISEQNLAKILREFEREDIVERVHEGKSTFVQLGFMGRVYVEKYGIQRNVIPSHHKVNQWEYIHNNEEQYRSPLDSIKSEQREEFSMLESVLEQC